MSILCKFSWRLVLVHCNNINNDIIPPSPAMTKCRSKIPNRIKWATKICPKIHLMLTIEWCILITAFRLFIIKARWSCLIISLLSHSSPYYQNSTVAANTILTPQKVNNFQDWLLSFKFTFFNASQFIKQNISYKMKHELDTNVVKL